MVMTAHRLNDRLITVLKAFDCKIIKIDEKISGVRLFRGSQKNVERPYNF